MGMVDVRDGLIRTIEAYGKWNSKEISGCDFGIANFSGSCVILQPGPGSVIVPRSFGTGTACGQSREKTREWEVFGILMVKDPGDAVTFLAKLWTGVDDIFNSVNADDSLDNTCEEAYISEISRPSIDAFISDGSVDWGFITFNVRATEL